MKDVNYDFFRKKNHFSLTLDFFFMTGYKSCTAIKVFFLMNFFKRKIINYS